MRRLKDYTPETKRALKAFLIAPALPIFALLPFSSSLAIIVLMIGLPAAYLGALIIGGPLYFLMRWLGLMSWSWTGIAGLLAAMPVLFVYTLGGSQNIHLQIHGAGNGFMLLLIGAFGGLAFWSIALWGSEREVNMQPARRWLGHVLLTTCVAAGLYVYFVARLSHPVGFVAGPLPTDDGATYRLVAIALSSGKRVRAILPSGLPYREHCKVHLTSRRSFADLSRLYWVISYKDAPFAGHEWQNMPPDMRAQLKIVRPSNNCTPSNS